MLLGLTILHSIQFKCLGLEDPTPFAISPLIAGHHRSSNDDKNTYFLPVVLLTTEPVLFADAQTSCA